MDEKNKQHSTRWDGYPADPQTAETSKGNVAFRVTKWIIVEADFAKMLNSHKFNRSTCLLNCFKAKMCFACY